MNAASENKIELKPPVLRSNLGEFLKQKREEKGLSLEELSFLTRISVQNLNHLELSDWSRLPHDVFVRGFLVSYSKEVGVDSQQVLAMYGEKASDSKSQALLTSLMATEKGQRFGLALAVVVLLILFTLTLSIVLQPRRRNTPVELSLRVANMMAPTSIPCPQPLI